MQLNENFKSNCINDFLPIEQKKEYENYQVVIYRSGDSGKIYEDILSIRAQTYANLTRKVRFEEDQYADLYCAYQGGLPVACMSAIRDTQGKLDCEDFYPPNLLQTFKGSVMTANRFGSIGRTMGRGRLGLLLMKAVVIDQLKQGVKLNIIAVRHEMIGYYLRHGYLLVAGSNFIHPITKNICFVMVLPADKNRMSAFQDLFRLFNLDLNEKKLTNYVKFCHCARNSLSKSQCICNTF